MIGKQIQTRIFYAIFLYLFCSSAFTETELCAAEKSILKLEAEYKTSAEKIRQILPSEISKYPKITAKWNTAADLWISLKSRTAFLDNKFTLRPIVGNKQSSKVVILIPQIHRAQSIPLYWSSLGFFTIRVQKRIDLALSLLYRDYGLKLIGTEGSSEVRILLPWDLQHTLWQLQSLKFQSLNIRKIRQQEGLNRDKNSEILIILERALQQTLTDRMQMLGGVNTFQSRLQNIREVHRFGLEKNILLDKALQLATKLETLTVQIEKLKTKQLKLHPQQQLREQPPQYYKRNMLAKLWMQEVKDYHNYMLHPLQQSLHTLKEQQKILTSRAAVDTAQDFSRYITFLQRLDREIIQSQNIEFYTKHFKSLEEEYLKQRDQQTPNQTMTTKFYNPKIKLKEKILSHKTRKKINKIRLKIQTLEKQQTKIRKQYQQITFEAREQFAVKTLLKNLKKLENKKISALIMGKNHETGLLKQLLKQDPAIAIIVLRPFQDQE